MNNLKMTAAAIILMVTTGHAFAVEDATKLPIIKDGQCYDTADAAEAAQDQAKCRQALGSNSGDSTSGANGTNGNTNGSNGS